MLSEISYGIKIWTDLSSVLPQCMRLTDRQTDGQTDCTCKCDDRNIPVEHGKIAESVAAGSGRGEGWHPPRVAQCRGCIWRGKNMEFWNLAASGELATSLYSNTDTCRKCEQQLSLLQLINLSSIALCNYTPNIAYCSQSTPMPSV